MLCPNCGAENTAQAEYCTHCGGTLKIETGQTGSMEDNNVSAQDTEHTTHNTAARSQPRITNLDFQSEQVKAEEPVVSTGLNVGVFLGTVIFPIIGFVVGFAYMRKAHPDARKAGKTWLIFAVIMLLVQMIMIYF